MKNYYLLMRFKGECVTGMLVLGQPDPESARMEAIRQLNHIVTKLREKYPEDPYSKVDRHRAFRRTLMKPWRRSIRSKDPVLEIMELPASVLFAGHWLGILDMDSYYCNIPRDRREHPMGYVCSRLTPEQCTL